MGDGGLRRAARRLRNEVTPVLCPAQPHPFRHLGHCLAWLECAWDSRTREGNGLSRQCQRLQTMRGGEGEDQNPLLREQKSCCQLSFWTFP